MNFKLINIKTKEETLCDKVTKEDGFDYYVSEEKVFENGVYAICSFTGRIANLRNGQIAFKVIATTNPNIKIDKVVDEVEVLANEYVKAQGTHNKPEITKHDFIQGYNKAKETFGNSDEDMVEFHFWLLSNSWLYHQKTNVFINDKSERKKGKELLELFKKQQPKKIYYYEQSI